MTSKYLQPKTAATSELERIMRNDNTVHHNKVQQHGAAGEYDGNFDYLLQHGAHIHTANAMRHMAHYEKT